MASPIITDGSLNFQGGVDSLKPTTVATDANPGGLPRNCLAWLINGTVRDGGISPRAGFLRLYKLIDKLDKALVNTVGYQGGFLYRPPAATPYLIFSVGGLIYKAVPDSGPPVNLSQISGLTNPSNIDRAFFCQGEQFLVIQAGDGTTLPLFWDGTTLRRSLGLLPPQNQTTIISTDPQQFTVPVAGQSVALTWTNVATLTTGSIVTIYFHNSSLSFGTYSVTAINGNRLTLQKQDANAGPFNVSGTFDLTVAKTVNPATVAELPAGYEMDYYMGRIWYSYGDRRTYTAGDIVGNTSSGTKAYNFTDSILKVTENPLAIGGDGFHIPSDGGQIRALVHTANLDASLGQGLLYPFTEKQVYSLKVPVSRGDWINANAANQPIQTVAQLTNGATGDRCVVPVNGDLYYQCLEPSIRSLIIATRFFGQPGNTPISSPENRIIQFDDRALLSFATGIEANNRMLQSALPQRVSQGVIHKALLPMDFTPLSEPKSTLPPVWEGHYEGLDFLQLFTGDFGGLQRSFAPVVSRDDGGIWLWELSNGSLTDDGDKRIVWQIEWPAFNWGDDFNLKELAGGELWIDRLSGTVEFNLEYRPDGYSCYIPWIQWKECSARDCTELEPPTCPAPTYPPTPVKSLGLGYRQTIGFPKPAEVCDTQMGRPSNIGHQFQPRLTIRGSCRIRGIFLHAYKRDRQLYSNVPCNK